MEVSADNHRIDNPTVTRDLEDLKDLTGLFQHHGEVGIRRELDLGGVDLREAALRAEVVRQDSRTVHHQIHLGELM